MKVETPTHPPSFPSFSDLRQCNRDTDSLPPSPPPPPSPPSLLSNVDSLSEEASPSASAAVKVQKVYRSYRTRRRLADTAVVAEELWWQAIDYVRLERSTISFFDFPETAASRWNRVSLNASKVGKGLSQDSKAQKLAFDHWIEAIDPRHRYGHNLHIYYDEWSNANSGQPFFYWLDVGDGKDLDLNECSRSKLRKQLINYLGPHEREHYEYIVVDGQIMHKLTGKPLKTSEGTKFIFVMSTSKKLYSGEGPIVGTETFLGVLQKQKGKFHHSSFLAGGATLAAGRFVVEDGTLKSISAYSGHYRPTDDRLDSFLSFLVENGVDLREVKIQRSNEGYLSYDDIKSSSADKTEVSSDNESPDCDNALKVEDSVEAEPEPALPEQAEHRNEYRRSLSGGLQSPRTQVPREAILQRINSKKAESYELGHQISRSWSTGNGPRIGCINDYPLELRFQALDFTALSPRNLPTLSLLNTIGGFASPPLLSPSS